MLLHFADERIEYCRARQSVAMYFPYPRVAGATSATTRIFIGRSSLSLGATNVDLLRQQHH